MKYTNSLRGGARGGNQGRNFRAKYGLLYAEVLDNGPVGRNGTLRGIGRDQARGLMLTDLKRINEQLAKELQELVAAKLESSRVDSRRGVASGRLKAAILDERNRKVTPFVMGVGAEKFLDTSQAKYWRSIELGTTQFLGNEIPGGWLWGSRLTGRYGGASQYGPYPLAGSPFSLTSSGRSDQRPLPTTKKQATAYLVAQGMNRDQAFLSVRKKKATTIKVPIYAHRMFRDAWRQFDGRARGQRALREAMYHAGLIGPQ